MKRLFLIVLIGVLFLFSGAFAQEKSDKNEAISADLAKATCHPVRKEILETLRSEVRSWSGQDVVFVVQFLKAKRVWAYAHVLPQSKDGKNVYEDVSVLLNREKGAWKIKETRPCCGECADDPDCADDRRYFTKLRGRFPSVPIDIFPSAE